VDLFKSHAVGLTRVEPRKHTRFSLFSCDRAISRSEAKRRDAARQIVCSSVVPWRWIEGTKGVATSMGTFKKHHRPRAKRSQPIADNPTARRPRPRADEPSRDCSVSFESPPTTFGGDSVAFGFPRQRGSRDRAEWRSPLKWCEWCRVSRRLECPVRAGDGPNERTNCELPKPVVTLRSLLCPNVRPAPSVSPPRYRYHVPVPRPVSAVFMTRRVASREPFRAAARRRFVLGIARLRWPPRSLLYLGRRRRRSPNENSGLKCAW